MTLAEPHHSEPTVEVSPLPGPLDTAPIVPRRCAQVMMDVALEGLEVGRFDRYVLRIVRGMDPFQVATVASLLARARALGAYEARAECAAEACRLREQLDALYGMVSVEADLLVDAARVAHRWAENYLREVAEATHSAGEVMTLSSVTTHPASAHGSGTVTVTRSLLTAEAPSR